MATQAFVIRASPPPPSFEDDADEAARRSAKCGLGRRSNAVPTSNGKPQFVRESKASQAWSGDWTRSEDQDDEVAEAATQDEVTGDKGGSEPTAPVAEVASAETNSMASLYAQLASQIAATAQAPSSPAQPQPSPALRPRVLTKRKRTAYQSSDWFIAKATEQMSKEDRRRDEQRRKEELRQVAQQREVEQRKDVQLIATTQASAETPTSIAPSSPATHQPGASSVQPCPTCSQLLPTPCPAPILRAHLNSIGHRMAQSAPSSPAPSSTTGKSKIASAGPPLPKLYIDSSNSGYQALQAMGWREGLGVGEEQWLLAGERAALEEARRIKEEEKEESERRRKQSGMVIVVESDDNEEAQQDVLFGPLQGEEHQQRSVSVKPTHTASPSPPPSGALDEQNTGKDSSSTTGPYNAPRPTPLLEPIAVQLKRDRLGLGKLRASTGRDYPTLGACASSSIRGSKQDGRKEVEKDQVKKRRDIVKQHERERREWLELRGSLN